MKRYLRVGPGIGMLAAALLLAGLAEDARAQYPEIQWIGQDILQIAPGSSAGSWLGVDREGDLLLFGRNHSARTYGFSLYQSGSSSWTPSSVPSGRRPVTLLKSNYGAAIVTDDNGSTPSRLYAMPDGGTMTELFAGNPLAGGGPSGVSVNATGTIGFYNAANNHSGTPKDYYRWTPAGGLEVLPRFPTDPTYSGVAVPMPDAQERLAVTLGDGIWRYDQGSWHHLAEAPPERVYGDGSLTRFAPDGSPLIVVRVQAANGAYFQRWLRCDSGTGQYSTFYDVPFLMPGLEVGVSSAAMTSDGTLTFLASSGPTVCSLIQVSPQGGAMALEKKAPGGLAINRYRYTVNDRGQVLASVQDLAGGDWSFRLWTGSEWTSLLSPELSNTVSSFALDDAGTAYFSFIDSQGYISVAAVPEPATLAFVAAGLGGLFAHRRRGAGRGRTVGGRTTP